MKHAHNCTMLARMNASRERSYTRAALIIIFVAFGMALAAIAFSHAYAGAVDALNNPHIEGF